MSQFAHRLLGEVATLQAGVGFPLDLQGRASGAYPLAKVGDISRGGRSGTATLSSADHFVDETDLERLRTKPIPKGSILFAKIGEAIRQNHRVITGCDMLVDNNAMAAIPRIGTFPEYLYHFLRTVDLYPLASTTTVPSLRKSDLERIPVPFPSLDEQRRIADVLDRAEALRAKRRAALAQLDVLRDSIFLSFHQLVKPHAVEVALAELAEATRGSFVNGPFGSDLLTTDLTSVGVPVVYIRDIRDREYRRVSTVCVTEAKAAALAVCSVKSGDVLVAKVGAPPGIAASYPDGAPPAIVTQDVVRIRLAIDRALPEYIVAYLNSVLGRRRVAAFTMEATRARFSLGDFKQLRLTVPPVSQQREFAAQIAAVDGLRAAQRRSLAELDALFASLQHRAFRGEL